MKHYLLLICVVCFINVNSQPLSGNYTINSAVATGGTNFQSFTDFAASLNLNGVSASVVATVTTGSGPYSEQVVFDNITGTSPTSTISIEGSGETVIGLTDTSARHVIRLKDCKNFTINNLHISRDTASISGWYGIHILNTGDSITVSGCVIDIDGTTSTLTGGVVASGSETSILQTGDFHNILITGNTFTGGGYGASVFGLVSNLASNIVISGNSFYDFHSNGIYLRETDGVIVSGNYFNKRSQNVTGTNAIQLAQAANVNGNIFNNYINVSQTNNGTQTIRGIYLFDGTGHKVYNNVIHHIHLLSGNFTAIEVRSGGTAPEISFNTVSLDTTAQSTGEMYGFVESLSNTNSILRNNLFNLTQPCSLKAAIVLGATSTVTTAVNSNYNDFWIQNGGNTAIKNSLTTPGIYTTLANWQSASNQDANSLEIDPWFISMNSPVPSNPAMNNAGVSITGITTDVTGILRNASPDIGAFEFEPVGIESLKGLPGMNLYPVPAGDFLILELSDNSGIQDVRIIDATGRVISRKLISVSEKSFMIDIATLSDGIYSILISNGSRQYAGKFIKHD